MKKKANIICSFILSLALLVGLFPAMHVHAAGSYSGAPQNLSVPPLAFDESKIVLTWEKPDDYYKSAVKIVDYEVYQDGKRLGFASENFKDNYSYVNTYMDAFYGKLSTQHHRISILSYTATGLAPKTNYEFKVRAVYADKTTSDFSAPLIFSTTSTPIVIDAASRGATYITSKSGDYIIRGANNNATVIKNIADNTAAIQAAIDATPPGGKVVLKGSGNNAEPWYYTSGSLFLHSNMTFEIAKGAVLLGSPVFDHYPRSLLVYPYSQDIRTYGLLNAVTSDIGSLENIRIVGEGAVDGNGWKNTTASVVQNKTAVDPSPGFTDPTGNDWKLPNYQGGSNSTVDNNSASDSLAVRGILAADAMWQSRQDQTPNSALSQWYNARPNLTVARGVHGLYYEGLTFYNPAFHGIVNYQSEQITANGIVAMMFDANNGDGIEFGDCLDLKVMNSFWDTGDDVINFAAGQGTSVRNLTDKVASGEGRVFNNFIRNGHGGLLAMGSHTGGWIGDLVAEENVYNTSETGSNGVLRMKSGATTGGGIRNIVVRDNAVNYSSGGNSTIVIDTSYTDGNASTAFGPESEQPLTFENVLVRNMTVSNTNVPLINAGAPGSSAYAVSPVLRNFTFEDIKILSYVGSGGNIAINGISDVTFRNISGLRGAITTTNSKNVTIENSAGTADRKPDALNGSGALTVTANTYNVTLNWPAINNATQYVVLVDMLDGYGYQQKKIVTSTGSGPQSTVIALRPSTSYKVAIRPETTGANASYGKLLESMVTTGAATLGASTISTTSPNFKVKAANITGISWQDFSWNAVTDAVYGVHYYELTATPKNAKYATKTYKAYFENSSRLGYSLWGLDDGVTYDVTMKAVNWIGQKGPQWGPVTITTVPGTLMQIPTWAPGSKLTVSGGKRIGDDMTITWNEKDVTDYSNGDTARFAGYRVLINGVPVDGGAVQATAKPTVKPGQNTYVLSTAGLLPNIPYTISVEAGSEILKYASGSGGLSGSTGFTGTKNTDLPRNQLTFGKWTGHGPSVTRTLLTPVAPTITTSNLPSGAIGAAYSQKLVATGDTPITWSIASGSLPVGLSLEASTGNISGTPIAAGTASFTVKATNDVGSTSINLSISISGSSRSSSGGGGGGSSASTSYSVSEGTKATNGSVSYDIAKATAGSKVTITVTPNEGYKLDTIKVFDQNGKEVNITKNADGTYSFIMPEGGAKVEPAFNKKEQAKGGDKEVPGTSDSKKFTDVRENDWFYNGIKFMSEKGLMVGTSENSFSPTQNITRAMLVTILYRLEGNPSALESSFTDVKTDTWYSGAVAWASSNTVISGYGNGLFGPNDDISREQLCTILYNYAKHKGYDISSTKNVDAFTDGNKLSSWAKGPMEWAIGSGLIGGYENNILAPTDTATRAQSSTIIQRFIEKVVK
ncbi:MULTISPECIES: S-layer homology domain-containing protein [unclassified Paenibacillus]|uniref:S-layer homology domain-containing protein n=1 Tax=unclassified Paenibacillus TaxID=185978 RepID=UPI00362E6E5A